MDPSVLTYAMGKNYTLALRKGLEHQRIEDLLKTIFIPNVVNSPSLRSYHARAHSLSCTLLSVT